jgi:UDP-N-acetyl-D-mannosaminuronate dehydrogenase
MAKRQFGIMQAGMIVGGVCLAIAFYTLYGLEETFSKELNYIED